MRQGRGVGKSIHRDEFFGSLDACGMVACGGCLFIHWQCRRSRYRSRMKSEIGSSGGDEAMRSARGCPDKLSLYDMRMRLRGLSGGACRQYMRISRMSSKAGMLRTGKGCGEVLRPRSESFDMMSIAFQAETRVDVSTYAEYA